MCVEPGKAPGRGRCGGGICSNFRKPEKNQCSKLKNDTQILKKAVNEAGNLFLKPFALREIPGMMILALLQKVVSVISPGTFCKIE